MDLRRLSNVPVYYETLIPSKIQSHKFYGEVRPFHSTSGTTVKSLLNQQIFKSNTKYGSSVTRFRQCRSCDASRIVCRISVDFKETYSKVNDEENHSGIQDSEEDVAKTIDSAMFQEENMGDQNEADGPSRATLIMRAVKLPMYTVALIPLTVGSSAAYLKTGIFHTSRFWSFLLSSVLVIAWLNLSNDAYDAETGVDKDKPESVVNISGSQKATLFSSIACLLFGLGGLFYGAFRVQDPRVGLLLAAAIACGYVYQCPPFRLSYHGLGEPLCFTAFGPFATTAFYLHQAGGPGLPPPVSVTALAASVLVGITTTLILFCSHFHQIKGDLSVGKLSPLVRLGTHKGAKVVKFAIWSLFTLTASLIFTGILPPTCAVGAFLTLPIGGIVVNFVDKNHEDVRAIFMAKYFCVRLHTAFGLSLALGLAFGRWKPSFLLA